MLNLQGVLVGKIQVQDNPRTIIVPCRSARQSALCPHCGLNSKRVHQTKTRLVKHGMINYQVVLLSLTIRRFKCRACAKVFTEIIPGISRDRASVNLKTQMLDWLRRNSFNFTGEQFKVSGSTLVRYLLKMTKTMVIDWTTTNITKLGIDEHSFKGHYLLITITDLSNHKLLAILKSDSQATLGRFINSIPLICRANIKEVCTDLRASYRTVVEELLPQANLTADRYHVETLARRALDDIRTIVQTEARSSRLNLKKLLWTNKYQLNEREQIKLAMAFKKYEHYPVLKQAWLIKEKIIQMYRAPTQVSAEQRFADIIMLLDTCDSNHYLSVLRKTLKQWQQPILNYFLNRTTNGFTEGCHTKIKMIKRVSYGFRNLNNYIAKITLAFYHLFGY